MASKKCANGSSTTNSRSEDELNDIEETQAKEWVRDERATAWEEFIDPIRKQVSRGVELIDELISNGADNDNRLQKIRNDLSSLTVSHCAAM